MRDVNAKIVADNNFRLAMQPKVTLPEDEKAVEAVIEGKSDLAYTVAMEILAPIELVDFKTDRRDPAHHRRAPTRRSRRASSGSPIRTGPLPPRPRAPRPRRTTASPSLSSAPSTACRSRAARPRTSPSLIGSGTFIPGFEDQLIGIGAGENRKVNVTFPENYPAAQLAGKEAVFDVTAKSIEAPGAVAIDDEFAKSLGLESLDKLKAAVRERIQREHDSVSKQKVKRALFDALDERHKFPLPPALVEQEFENLWKTANYRDEGAGQDLRGREHDRGEGAGGISQDRRSPRPARPSARRDRAQERDQGHRRRSPRARSWSTCANIPAARTSYGRCSATIRKRSPAFARR